MNEHGMLFIAPMVNAFLRDTKSQTRRIVNKLRRFGQISEFGASTTPGYDWSFRDKRMLWNDIRTPKLLECCPYGQVGDRIWVREPFIVGYPVDGQEKHYSCIPWTGADEQRDGKVFYKADGDDDPAGPQRPWRSPIHMPRWAARLTYELAEVRVEALKAISALDAQAEGVEFETADPPFYYVPELTSETAVGIEEMAAGHASASYRKLWEYINGTGSWDENPYVWVLTLKQLTTGVSHVNSQSKDRRSAADRG